MSRKVDYFPFRGGMDFVTPPITVSEGRMISGRNFEPWIDGGYRRVSGYERYSGQPKPSEASWTELCMTAPFDPEVAEVPGDSDFADVVSLLHFDADFTDTIGTNTWVGTDTPTIDVVTTKFGAGSLDLNGTSQYLTETDPLLPLTGDFTIDAWVYADSVSDPDNVFFCQYVAADAGRFMFKVSSTFLSISMGATTYSTATVFPTAQWVHVACVRSGTNFYLFQDGVLVHTEVLATAIANTKSLIGAYDLSGVHGGFFNGRIDDMRITTVARWTSGFTPPTTVAPDDAGSPAYTVTTVTGDTSGATGELISYVDECIYVTKVTGVFEVAETINSAIYTISSITNEGGASIAAEAAIRLAAETEYRNDIAQVVGVNEIRGIWQIKDRVYAIRDNAGETAGIIHKATPTGWDDTLMDMSHYVRFTGGLVQPAIGDTLDGATSSATGTIHKIIVHTGSWGTSDAAGYFVLTGVTGTYTDTENLQVTAVTQAVASGGSVVFALPVGGRYSFVSENFYAGAASYRVYAAGGVGPAFEIDENDVVTPILMDLTLGDSPAENTPHLVAAWDGKLWLGFDGGSVQHSITGDPLTWNGFLGAAEYGLGEELTSLSKSSGDILIARTRRDTHGFFKGSPYTKQLLSDRAGGILYSDEELNTSFSLDDSGLTNVRRVQEFGDFANATLSDLIQPYLDSRKETVAGSMVVRESNQYRVLYANGEGVIARIRPDGVAEFGLLSMPTTVHCAYSCEDENGTPTNWFGGGSGYVYQAEIGRNWDGAVIEASARLPFNHQGQPHMRKRYRLLELELQGERAVELYMASDLSYAGSETGSQYWEDDVVGGGGFFDADNWDQIYWDAQQFSTARFEILGTGKNVSVLFYSTSNTTEPFILQGAQLHYELRREQR